MRNLLAPSAGVRRPICWNLAQMVVWQQRDSFNGEDEPPATFRVAMACVRGGD
jgi:hypothetical protein